MLMEVTYADGGITAIFNGRSYRIDRRTGYYLAANRENGKRKRLHIAVWESHNGPVPEGHRIHHIDRNKANNEIENLQCLTASEHNRIHAALMTDERREQLRRNLIENAVPRSKAWHRSDEGREWHREHGIECFRDREPMEYVCTNCGKTFESKKRYSDGQNRFCGNNCRAAYRRKTGVDDIEIVCEVCGCVFKANKYDKRTKCRECTRKRK